MNKFFESKKGIAVIAVAVVVVVLLVLVQQGIIPGGPVREGAPKSDDIFRPDNLQALPTVQSGTREMIQKEIVTPEPDNALTTPTSSDIAVPTGMIRSVNGGVLRSFILRGENKTFSPNTLVANEGDVIQINFTATDQDYDIFFPDFGAYQIIKKGTAKEFQFQAYPYGQYTFSCKDVCRSSIKGELIVNEIK